MLGDSKDNSAPLVRNVTEPRLMSYSSSIVYDKVIYFGFLSTNFFYLGRRDTANVQ